MAHEPWNRGFCEQNQSRGLLPGLDTSVPHRVRRWVNWTKLLGDLASRDVCPILPLDGLHLVPQTQFQLFQSDFFQFFVVGKVTLVGKRGETLLKLRVLLGQLAELFMRGQEVVSRGEQPAD